VTIAICQPTRAVWMTGRYPHRSGALGFNPIKPDVPTLVESLSAAGYFTGVFAKTGHVVPTRHEVWDQHILAKYLNNGRNPAKYYKYSRDFFEAAKTAGKPFFLMANSQDPHRPFAGSDQEKAAIVKDPQNKTHQYGGGFPGFSRSFTPEEIPVPGFLPDLELVRLELSEYFASVHRADQITGEILRALEESGLSDNTLVVFMSDHGMPLPFAKTNCYLHSTKTPWVVRWPGVVEPGAVDERHVISGIDFAPTVFEATGVAPFDGMDGRSIVGILKGGEQSGRNMVFTQINTTSANSAKNPDRGVYPIRAATTRRYGYIFNGWADGETLFQNESMSGRTFNAMAEAAKTDAAIADRVRWYLYRGAEEFYDYRNDPFALDNLINDPKHAKRIENMRKRVLDKMRETNDPQLAAFERSLSTQKGAE
jgi:N-sulfoglucosamine sulfohydrolase